MPFQADDVVREFVLLQNGNGNESELERKRLTKLLGIQKLGLAVTSVRVTGRGMSAEATMHLSDGSEIEFDALRDVASPSRLATQITACTGALPKLNGQLALEVLSLMVRVAEHETALSRAHASTDWGLEFLSGAMSCEFDINDQGDRWEVFSQLDGLDPFTTSQRDGISFLRACVVPVDRQGVRYVRRGWFREHVRRIDAAISPQQITQRMLHVGWQIRGRQGRIMARCPTRPASLVQAFFLVPDGWLEALHLGLEEEAADAC